MNGPAKNKNKDPFEFKISLSNFVELSTKDFFQLAGVSTVKHYGACNPP